MDSDSQTDLKQSGALLDYSHRSPMQRGLVLFADVSLGPREYHSGHVIKPTVNLCLKIIIFIQPEQFIQ